MMYSGGYTDAHNRGIIAFRYANGHFEQLKNVCPEVYNPSYLLIRGKMLYCVMEEGGERPEAGGVSAFSIQEDGSLLLSGRIGFSGKGACHLAVDQTGRYLVTANYTDGSVCLIALEEDGSLGALLDTVCHNGPLGPIAERQEGPHAHCVHFTQENILLVTDLGLDKILAYRIDKQAGRLEAYGKASFCVKPGSGPRHLLSHRDKLYVVHELSCEVSVYQAKKESYEEIQRLSALPAAFVGENTCGAIRITEDKKRLYITNRGHDSIAVFSIDANGLLDREAFYRAGGRIPRDFALWEAEGIGAAACQRSNSLSVFALGKAGELQLKACIPAPSPCSIVYTSV